MRRVLEELVIDGPANNADLLHQILYHPDFVRGHLYHRFPGREPGHPAQVEQRRG